MSTMAEMRSEFSNLAQGETRAPRPVNIRYTVYDWHYAMNQPIRHTADERILITSQRVDRGNNRAEADMMPRDIRRGKTFLFRAFVTPLKICDRWTQVKYLNNLFALLKVLMTILIFIFSLS